MLGRSKQSTAQTATGQEQTTKIQRASLVFDVNATGRVTPEQKIALAFKTSGRVYQIMVQEGDLVEQGQVLATLETASLEQALLQAEATHRVGPGATGQGQGGGTPRGDRGGRSSADQCQGRGQSRRNGCGDRQR